MSLFDQLLHQAQGLDLGAVAQRVGITPDQVAAAGRAQPVRVQRRMCFIAGHASVGRCSSPAPQASLTRLSLRKRRSCAHRRRH